MKLVSPILKSVFRRFPNTAVTIPAGHMRGTKWLIASANPGQVMGRYESLQEQTMVAALKHAKTFWDIGAHVGWYTLLAHKVMAPKSSIVSFEPNPNNRIYLDRHVQLNQSQIQVSSYAISDSESTCFFSGDEQTGGLVNNDQPAKGYEVQTISIDLFAEANNSYPDLIKMDVEGAEDKALNGASQILSRYKPILLLSAHGWEKRDACKEILSAYGYRFTDIVQNSVDGDYVFLAECD